MLDTFAVSQQERLGRGTLGGALDYLTLGMVSGFGRGLRDRWDTARREPSLYSIANWLSLGFANEVKGAVSPKEPLSLEHWLHSLAVAGTLAGAYEMAKPRSLPPTSTAELRGAAQGAEVESVAVLDKELMDELAESGVKYNVDDVVMVTKNTDGKLLWLEKGNDTAGLKHIIDGHAADFAAQGVENIPGFLNEVLKIKAVKVGTGAKGPFAEYIADETRYRVAYGSNGYIVSFYPID